MLGLGYQELLIIGVIAILLFGERLPEVGRSVGRSLIEFKKGLRGIEDELNSAVSSVRHTPVSNYNPDDHDEPTAPKFEPPTSAPRDESVQV